MATPQEHFEASRQFQAYYDETLRRVGTRAPAPALGQSVNDYRRETLRQLKRTFLPPAHQYYQVQYRSLRADALDAIEPQFLTVIETEALNPANLAPGEIRPIEKIDEFGNKRIDWVGRESFVRDMMPASRRVLGFRTPQGFMNTSGRYIR